MSIFLSQVMEEKSVQKEELPGESRGPVAAPAVGREEEMGDTGTQTDTDTDKDIDTGVVYLSIEPVNRKIVSRQEKRKLTDIDLKRELPGLLEYGVAKGCFKDPNMVFCVEEWRRLGDVIWENVIDEDKVAKKLAQSWQAVTNCLAQHQAEQNVAQKARKILNGQGTGDKNPIATASSRGEPPEPPEGTIQLGKQHIALPPSTANVFLPASSSSAVPSAPPLPRPDPSPCNSTSNHLLESIKEETVDPLSPSEEEELEEEAVTYHHEEMILATTTAPPQKPRPAPRLTRSRARMWHDIHREAVLAGDMQMCKLPESCMKQ
ncbi:hypothetical protein HGM15179_016805 [Zosterops borbonicus]|uniref:Uncharacterized protein n=1 Tax=Zosterops borbonicus TaxID=364589 RepID=A0A8K1LE00_9PASS|nr:hypothetical protein HGM15179_016805 [Zosterops borbonicus]